jgi:hypothetical protein
MKRRIARLQVRRAQQAAAQAIDEERAAFCRALGDERRAFRNEIEVQDQRAIQMMEQALRTVLDKVGRFDSYKLPLEQVVSAAWRPGSAICDDTRTIVAVTGDQVAAIWTLLGRVLPGLRVPTLHPHGEAHDGRRFILSRIPR